ncbi:MAG TPA: 1-(5-phosphoribosyl)-5-[(5-phosphoribosylamino)methylideneamino]imidazole-4-carboxamide isomerase [Elusimicrobiota bacterium]|nr:1-(5-phosphoribosyl)-5-[(5-phosphoribosylamino)methylideneamino]imidazole-4-carboxamide isomerase [Elusimicrobiota bacterium]
MQIFPAIDIRRGNCVRLYQGRKDRETIYSKDPLQMARLWKSKGARRLHVADLDGAFQGKPANIELAAAMRKELDIPVQMGGGFRDMASIDTAIQAGIDRIILGTAAVYNEDLVIESVRKHGKSIAVSIDVSDDYVAVGGWTELSAVRFEDLARTMRQNGITELLFTDTRKDGTLSGPNLEGIRRFLKAAQVPVTVSGGISSVDDVAVLKTLEGEGLKAVVIGKALYDEKIVLEEALRVAGDR